MIMQHQQQGQSRAGWNQHLAPPLGQQQHYGYVSQNLGSASKVRSLWIGNLEPWMDKVYLMNIFCKNGEALSARVVRNKQTGQAEGYGFIEFINHSVAETVLQTFNGAQMPKCEQTFRLNWAHIGAEERCQTEATHQNTQGGNPGEGDTKIRTIYVGGLNASVTDDELKSIFGQFGEIVEVKILPGKHCGFVKFANRKCAEDALLMLNGAQLGRRSIRLSWSCYEKPDQAQWNGGGSVGYPPQPQGSNEPFGYAPHPPPPRPPPPQPQGSNQPSGYAPLPPPPPPSPQPQGSNESSGYASHPPPPSQSHDYNIPYGYASHPPPPSQPQGSNEPYGYAPHSHPPPRPPQPQGSNEPSGYASHPPPPPQPQGSNEPSGYASHPPPPPPPPPQPHGSNEPSGYASHPPPPSQPQGYNVPYGCAFHPTPSQPHGYSGSYGYAAHPPLRPQGYNEPCGYSAHPPPRPQGYNEPCGYAAHPPPRPQSYNEPHGYAAHPPPRPHGCIEPFGHGYASHPPPPTHPHPQGYNESYGYASHPPPPQLQSYNKPYSYASHPPFQNPNAYYGGYTGYGNYQHQQQQ